MLVPVCTLAVLGRPSATLAGQSSLPHPFTSRPPAHTPTSPQGITCVPEVAALPFDRQGMPPPSSSCPAPQSTPSAPLDDGPTQEQPRHVRARHCSMDLDTESGLNGLDGFVPAV